MKKFISDAEHNEYFAGLMNAYNDAGLPREQAIRDFSMISAKYNNDKGYSLGLMVMGITSALLGFAINKYADYQMHRDCENLANTIVARKRLNGFETRE